MKDEEIKLPAFNIDVDDEFLWDRFIDWVNAPTDKRYKLAEAVDDELLRLLHDYAREAVRLNLPCYSSLSSKNTRPQIN